MPMIWTHILFAEEVIDRTENIVSFTLDENYLTLGAQGNNLLEFIPFYSCNQFYSKNITLKLAAKNSEKELIKFIKSFSSTNKHINSYLIWLYYLLFFRK